MMTGVLWLRASSIVSLLFAVGHTLGGRQSWSPIGRTDVLTSMETFRFNFQGVTRTYLDFYRGFGFSLGLFLLLQAIVLWQLCDVARASPRLARPIVGSFALATAIGSIITWEYIFPLPAVFSAALTICLALAFFTMR